MPWRSRCRRHCRSAAQHTQVGRYSIGCTIVANVSSKQLKSSCDNYICAPSVFPKLIYTVVHRECEESQMACSSLTINLW